MKKKILLCVFGLLSFAMGKAQCTANGTGFGNNPSIPSYNVSGMVSVVLNDNNTITVNLGSNFSTASGPDVRVFLVDRGTLTNAQLRMTNNFLSRPRVEMGLVNGNGAASFTQTIPNGVTISNFNTIYFYCQQFNAFWDFGSFMPFTSSNCATLSNESIFASNFKVYPNPSKGTISIDFDEFTEIKSFQIYSALGQKVVEINEPIQSKTSFDLTNLESGIYFLHLIDVNNKTYTKKISLN
ncbi:MAG: DM13 domain-containing protein [Flavobacterium sp.]|uniref:DM13 domain-containing protein n=1 Tax=Flavobacterium aureirubrum TaxID=3133147 RepID=A0ABU9N8B1_9FLAO